MTTIRLSLLLLLTTACVTGSTLGSGVGDRMLQDPPYYAGYTPRDGGSVGHLPVAWQRGATDSPIFEPASEAGSPVAALLADMNGYLDSLGVSVRLADPGAPPWPGTAPDVRFGCNVSHGDDCEEDDPANEGVSARSGARMRLAVGRPSPDWVSGAARAAEQRGAAHVLVITLEASQYVLRQRGWQGRKVVELGTDHSVSQPWLTSLDKPVNVIQLTGALLDRNGKAVRIGAEGLLAKRTGLVMSALGAQALVTDEDVEALRTARRGDLPGAPLVWREAMRTLVEGLVGRRG